MLMGCTRSTTWAFCANATAGVNSKEGVVDISILVASPDLPKDVRAAVFLSKSGIFHLCSVQNVNFRTIVGKHKLGIENSDSKLVYFVLLHHRCYVRRVRNDQKHSDNLFSTDDVRVMAQFCGEVRRQLHTGKSSVAP